MNMFDLTSQRSTLAAKPQYKKHASAETTKYTETDVKKLLEGYTELPREKWPNIQKNDHIRYRRIRQNLFRRGGFVVNQWINAETQKRMIQLIPNPYISQSSKNAPWTINYDDIQNIWVKNKTQPQKEQLSESDSDDEDSKTINKQIEEIYVELARLSNEQKNIVALIKKLHKL